MLITSLVQACEISHRTLLTLDHMVERWNAVQVVLQSTSDEISILRIYVSVHVIR